MPSGMDRGVSLLRNKGQCVKRHAVSYLCFIMTDSPLLKLWKNVSSSQEIHNLLLLLFFFFFF